MIKIQKEDKELLENVLKTYRELKETAFTLQGKYGEEADECSLPNHGDLYLFYLRVDAFSQAVYNLEKSKYNFNHGGILTHLEYMYLEIIKSSAVDLKMLLCGIPLHDSKSLNMAVKHISSNSAFLIYPGSVINKIVSDGLKRYEEAFSAESVETTTKKIEGVKNGRNKK